MIREKELMKNVVIFVLLLSFILSNIYAHEFKSAISTITSDIKKRMCYSWNNESPIPLEDLRYVTVSHCTFDGKVEKGELVVHKAIAQDIVNIFKELFQLGYPLTCMKLVDEFQGDDDVSMAANNCYAHCTRKVARENRWSNHAYGLAIDINPQINPYVNPGKKLICPKNGEKNLNNRSANIPGMITKDSAIYKLFIEHGFEWGGECFDEYEDLHHFQKIIFELNKTQN